MEQDDYETQQSINDNDRRTIQQWTTLFQSDDIRWELDLRVASMHLSFFLDDTLIDEDEEIIINLFEAICSRMKTIILQKSKDIVECLIDMLNLIYSEYLQKLLDSTEKAISSLIHYISTFESLNRDEDGDVNFRLNATLISLIRMISASKDNCIVEETLLAKCLGTAKQLDDYDLDSSIIVLAHLISLRKGASELLSLTKAVIETKTNEFSESVTFMQTNTIIAILDWFVQIKEKIDMVKNVQILAKVSTPCYNELAESIFGLENGGINDKIFKKSRGFIKNYKRQYADLDNDSKEEADLALINLLMTITSLASLQTSCNESPCTFSILEQLIQFIKFLIENSQHQNVRVFILIFKIIWHCGRYSQKSKTFLRKNDTLEILKTMIESDWCEDKYIKCFALKNIALIGDTETSTINNIITDAYLDDILKSIDKTLNSPVHTCTSIVDDNAYIYDGLDELLLELYYIATSDNIKEKLLNKHIIDLLERVINSAINDEEKYNACRLLWSHSFLETAAKAIKDNSKLTHAIFGLKLSGNKLIRDAADGIIWEIYEKDASQAKIKSEQPNLKESQDIQVMLSYKHTTKQSVHKICAMLRANQFKVWIDVDNMTGKNLNEKMAEGVETSDVVILCICEEYKESNSCRKEADYADTLAKPLRFIMLEENYQPRGWLGLLMGQAFQYRCFNDSVMKEQINALCKDIRSLLAPVDVNDESTEKDLKLEREITCLPVNLPTQMKPLVEWQSNDVSNWLEQCNLHRVKEKLLNADGRYLRELKIIADSNREFFYSKVGPQHNLSFDEAACLIIALDSVKFEKKTQSILCQIL